MGGGPKNYHFPNSAPKKSFPPQKERSVPAKKLDHAGSNQPANQGPAPRKILSATNSHMTGDFGLSLNREKEEDWEPEREEKRRNEGKKRRRSVEEDGKEDLGGRKKLKKEKLYEDLKKLHVARTGVRVRLESEVNQEPSIAQFCHKIDRINKLVKMKPQNELNGEGLNI